MSCLAKSSVLVVSLEVFKWASGRWYGRQGSRLGIVPGASTGAAGSEVSGCRFIGCHELNAFVVAEFCHGGILFVGGDCQDGAW
jgi:hypothetical protein